MDDYQMPPNFIPLNRGVATGVDKNGRVYPITPSKATMDINPYAGSIEEMNEYDNGWIPQTGITQEQNRWNNQSGWDKTFNGIGRLLSTTATKTATTISDVGGFLGSLIPAAGGIVGDVVTGKGLNEIMGNAYQRGLMTSEENPLSQAFRSAEEHLKEMMPVYKSDTYKHGTVWDKISTGEWLADDFVDGIAFLGSSMITGAGAGKALSAVSMGSKFGNMFKTAEMLKAGAIIEEGRNFSNGQKIVNALVKMGMDAGTPLRGGVTAITTVGESMAEGYDTYKTVKDKLLDAKSRGENNFSDEDIEKTAKDAYQGTFQKNMLALAAPNWIETSWFLPKGPGLRQALKAEIMATGKMEKIAKEVFPFKKIAGGVVQGALAESWEENAQLAIQNYEQDMAERRLSPNDKKYISLVYGKI